jgi:hypothetical protein
VKKTKNIVTVFNRRWQSASPHDRCLYVFQALSLVGGMVYGLYYGIFLYRQTFSLSILAIDGLLGGLGVWLGYLAGVMLIKRSGYTLALKTAFGLWAVISFMTALIAGHIAQYFMILAVLRTLPAGMYAATFDTIMLREVKAGKREKFLQLKLAFEFLAGVILPSAIGGLIHLSGGYQFAFVLAGIIYAGALLVPLKLNRPKFTLTLRDVAATFRRPLYPQHGINRTMAAGFNQLNGFVVMIIPFLLLKNEAEVGLLTSMVALAAGVVSIMVRKIKEGQKLRFGYGAYLARAAAAFTFIVAWSPPVLLVWQMVNKMVTPLHDPLQQNLDIQNDSLILGEDLSQKALHINLLNSTLLLIGSSAAFGSFFLLNSLAGGQEKIVLQLLIAGFASWRLLNLLVSVRINRRARNPHDTSPILLDRPALTVPLKRSLNLQALRLVTLFAR